MSLEISQQIVHLFVYQVLPPMLIVALGYGLVHIFRLDINTLNRINLYVLAPAFIISRMLHLKLSAAVGWQISGVYLLQIILLLGLSMLVASLLGYKRSVKTTVTMASTWGNTGNLGLPLIELTLGTAAVAFQIVLVVVNAITIFTLGIGLIASGRLPLKKALLSVAGQPVIYALLLTLVLRGLDWGLPQPINVPLDYLGDAMIPIALLTLGCQLASTKRGGHLVSGLWPAILIRLLVAPVLMFLLVWLFGLEGLVAKVLVIGSSVPVAVNAAILAIEYKNEQDLAARVVFWSTLACGLTLPVVIYLANTIF